MKSLAAVLFLLALGAPVAEAQYDVPGILEIVGKRTVAQGAIAFVKVRCVSSADPCKAKVRLRYAGKVAGTGRVTLNGPQTRRAAVRLKPGVLDALNKAGRLEMTAIATGRSGGNVLNSARKPFTVKSACRNGVCPR